jgi:flagellar biosynthesis/type III secretory pathway protein FliH
MRKTFGGALLVLAFAFGIIVTTSTTADAQWRRDRGYGGYNNQQLQQGYQDGLNTGASDAQRRQSYNPQRSHFYKNASSQAFRDGFVRGYDEGYRQYSGDYRNGGYRNRGDRNDGYYGNGRYGRNGGYGGYESQEVNAGYQQGLNTGASDGQRGQGYNPERSRYYRNASTQAYRDGFVRGYDEGYRQYSRNGNYRRSNSAGTILEQIFGRPW